MSGYTIKNYLSIIFLLFSCVLAAQEVDYKINEVRVSGSLKDYYSEDTKREQLDSLLVINPSFINLGEALMQQGGLVVSSYGSRGSLAGIKIRGTGDNHTSFEWNGIPLNSLTTGTMDASLIPAGFMQDISITKGASGVMAGNSSFGGAVSLNNKPDWSKKIDVSIRTEAGSFGYRAVMPSLMLSNSNIQYRISYQNIHSDNDYPFTDYYKAGSPKVIQANDSLDQVGLMQNLFIRLKQQFNIDIGLWTSRKNKDIPSVMGAYQLIPANQSDRTLKAYTNATGNFRTSRLKMQLAYTIDSLSYIKTSPYGEEMINSQISTQGLFASLEWRWFVKSFLTIDLQGRGEHLQAVVDAYGMRKDENRYSLVSAAKYRKNGWIINLGLRKEFNPYNPPRPLGSIGVSWKSKDKDWMLRGNVSNKFRIPTFNERYWQPGGNPDLEPESGWGGELAGLWNFAGQAGGKHQLESVLFYQEINNWIQWLPGEGFWAPRNQDHLRTRGFEISGLSTFELRKTGLSLIYKGAFTDAKRLGEGGELQRVMYVPGSNALIGFVINRDRIYGGMSLSYLSKRYTSNDLNPIYMLDPVYLLDLKAGITKNVNKLSFNIYTKINNLLNYHYQMIRSYATPGISASLGLSISFNKPLKSIK